jgi:hypothetical protein
MLMRRSSPRRSVVERVTGSSAVALSNQGPVRVPTARVSRLVLALVVVALGCLAVVAAPSLALDTHAFSSSFAGAGAGAGQVSLAGNSGVAVNDATHDVYVADAGNARVDQFSAAGGFVRAWGWGVADGLPMLESCTLVCQAGVPGAGVGQFTTPTFVAVDNSAGPSAGDVYVGDAGTNRVLKFSASGSYISTNDGSGATAPVAGPFGPLAGVTVNGSGDLWVYDQNGNMFEFAPNASFITDWNSLRGVTPNGIDVDSAGNVYVLTGAGSVEQFTAGGTQVGAVNGDAIDPTGFALDRSSSDVYMDSGGVLVRHYDPACDAGGSCTALDTFGSGGLNGAAGLAADSSSHDVFAVDTGDGRIDRFTAVALPDAVSGQATALTASTATLNGTVNPNSTTLIDCHFSYADDAHYDASATNPYTTGQTAPCASTPTGASPVAVSADVAGLAPGTLYHFRVQAANANGPGFGSDQTFITPGPPTVDSSSVANVTSSSAELRAQLNPNSLDTTYHFQYGASTTYGQSTPESTPIGADFADHPVNSHIQGLTPNTTYHFRVVATNSLALGGATGPDHTFTTQPTSSPVVLPDNRGYELVTPADKADGYLGIPVRGGQATLGFDSAVRASVSGDKFAFPTLTPFAGAQSGAYGGWLASRGPDGWSSQALSPHQAHDGGAPITAYTPDLSKLVMLDGGGNGFAAGQDDPPLVSGEPADNQNIFLRDNFTGSYQLVNAMGSNVNSSPAFFKGTSTDLSHILFASNNFQLYQWFDGVVSLVSQVPSAPATSCGSGGPTCVTVQGDLGVGSSEPPLPPLNAVSSDGSRSFFSTLDPSLPSQLYVRDNGARTVEVSASQKTNGTGPGGTDPNAPHSARYWTATPDGSEVFFSSCDQLTNDSTASSAGDDSTCHSSPNDRSSGQDLYQYDTNTGGLVDLTVDRHGDPSGADVYGVLGASADGSYVYFVANGVLAPGASLGDCPSDQVQASGSCNLYVAHNGTATFIARVDGHDFSDWSGISTGAGGGGGFTARVTLDGRHLAFDSVRSLTGVDNRDAVTGQPDNEVFLYDAGTGRLACASCNPSGAQPTGDSSIVGSDEYSVSGGGLGNAGWDTGLLYLPRNLSDDGSRLFFESTDALVVGDVNAQQDVYEYENGRPRLISSGTSGVDSSFFDASPSGNDVFFETAAQLVSQDTDRKLDIYDARVGGGFPSTPVGVACSGDACKAPPSNLGPSVVLGSSSFAGPGNPAVAGVQPTPRPKALTRAQLLARALRVCAKKPRRQRAACRAHARKLRGAKKAGKAVRRTGK